MIKRVFVGILVVFMAFSTSAVSAPKRPVELIPQRIILEGRDRSSVLKLLNRNSESMTYRIETIMLRQTVSGGTQRVTDLTPEEQNIIKMIRFSPRQVSVPPNSMQTVRIMARKPSNLADGEYRAHLQVVPIPEPVKDSSPSKGIAVNLDIVISVSIPLIIRHGDTHVKFAADDALPERERDGSQAVKVLILADGNRSAYMDASLYYGEKLIGERKGFAIYQPNGRRNVSFPLKTTLPPSGSSLKLILHDREKDETPLLGELPILLKY